MSDTVVIDLAEAEAEAYDMGVLEFDGVDVDDYDEMVEYDAGAITDGARYANIILPKLRAFAGMEDDGTGCYQGDREVVIIDDGARGDLPMDATITQASSLISLMVDTFFEGAHASIYEAFVEKDLRIEMTGR